MMNPPNAHPVTSIFFTEFIICKILLSELEDFYHWDEELSVLRDYYLFHNHKMKQKK